MPADFNWTCPHCERAVTISEERESTDRHSLWIENAVGRRVLLTTFIVCPNQECRRFTLTAALYESEPGLQGRDRLKVKLEAGNRIPPSQAKTFPTYIPQAIRDDYREACLILDLSPKASATLARRCLQGMLRDFWKGPHSDIGPLTLPGPEPGAALEWIARTYRFRSAPEACYLDPIKNLVDVPTAARELRGLGYVLRVLSERGQIVGAEDVPDMLFGLVAAIDHLASRFLSGDMGALTAAEATVTIGAPAAAGAPR